MINCTGFLFWHPVPFCVGTCLIYQAELVLIHIVLHWRTFSLVFLIHLLLYAGVYCSLAFHCQTQQLEHIVVCNKQDHKKGYSGTMVALQHFIHRRLEY